MPPKQVEPEKTGPDETEIRRHAVVAATFANVELETTKKTLAQYIQLYQQTRDANNRLAQEMNDREKDSMNIVQFLRAELEKRQDQLKKQQQTAENDQKQLQKEFAVEREQLEKEIAERDQTIENKDVEIANLNASLEALETFKRERQQLHMELCHFKDQLKNDTARYEAEISKLRFQSLEEKVRLKAEERSLSENFNKAVNEKAMRLLDTRTREINEENHKLLHDKVLLEKELDDLSQQNRQLKTELDTVRRDVQLTEDQGSEHVKRNVQVGRENKELAERADTLGKNLVQCIEEYEKKIVEMERRFNGRIEQLETFKAQAYKETEAKHRELVRVRQLARGIVQQRSDLENFFNEALEYVRVQISQERAEHLKLHGGKPQLALTSGPQSSQHRAGGGTGGKNTANNISTFFHGAGNFESVFADDVSNRDGGGRAGTGDNNPPHPESRGSLPPIHPNAPPHSNQGPAAASAPSNSNVQKQRMQLDSAQSTVDVSQLSWVDKERVLRILFAKINASTAKANSAAHPPASRELPSAASSIAGAIEDKKPVRGDDTFVTQLKPL